MSDQLKPQIDTVTEHIDFFVHKLECAEAKFIQKDKAIFAKIVEAYHKHDGACTCVLVYDRVEVRKAAILLINSKVALDQIAARLRAASETGGVASSLGSSAAALRTIKPRLVSVFPETENELNEIGKMLDVLLVDACQGFDVTVNSDSVEADANKILSDAAATAKQRIKETFPA